MDSRTRRINALQADENAGVLPSKQASMAATLALQQARAMEAPQLPRRAVLQPIPQNLQTAVRSASVAPTRYEDESMAEMGTQTDEDEDERTQDESDATIEDIAIDNPDSHSSAHVIKPNESNAPAQLGIEVAEDVDDELDDAQLLHHDHTHTASFSDDEDDVMDILNLREAIRGQPPAECNPHALFPIDNITSRIQMEQSARIVADTPGLLDSHDEDTWDPSMVLEYSEDIFRHIRVMELRLLPEKGYMSHQKELSWEMRGVLVDWLVKVHYRFNLLPETLFLCVNYIDRFLSIKEVSLSRLQLVGAVALFIAAKFEEINYLSVHEVSQMVEQNYEVEEILKAERFMIDILDFNLGFPGPMSFLRRVSKADDYELETRTLAKYLLELQIMDERFVAVPPSWSAAVAHYMSRHMLRQGDWTPRHVFFSGYTEEQLLSGVAAVRESIEDPKTNFNAVFEKYSEKKFRKAAQFVTSWLQLVKQHPQMDFH